MHTELHRADARVLQGLALHPESGSVRRATPQPTARRIQPRGLASNLGLREFRAWGRKKGFRFRV